MPNLRRLLARKFIPGLLSGKIDAADLADGVTEEIAANITPRAVADGSITPDKLDRPYIEASFGVDAEGQPLSVLRKIIRLWVQDDKVYGESDDEF